MPLTPLERKSLMVLREVTQTSIAAEVGLTQGYVGHVVAGIARNARIEEAIARKLGILPEIVFGPRAAETPEESTEADTAAA